MIANNLIKSRSAGSGMRLLIVTQAVDYDDPVLGFFVRWITEIATRCEVVHVICLKEGVHALPSNVHVHSLGKEGGRSRFKYLFRFFRYVYVLRRDYDSVFVHMNPEYVVLGGLFWRLTRKKIALWYLHRATPLALWLALRFADIVFTATKDSMRIPSDRVRIVGHGIDTDAFLCLSGPRPPRILSIGRISPIKNYETFIEAIRLLKDRGIDVTAEIVGVPVYESDRAYKAKLEESIRNANIEEIVSFRDGVSYREMPSLYCGAAATVNLSPTGGSDKVVLESLACGTAAFTSNAAFHELFGNYASTYLVKERDAANLANALEAHLKHPDTVALESLQKRVRESYSLTRLIVDIHAALSSR